MFIHQLSIIFSRFGGVTTITIKDILCNNNQKQLVHDVSIIMANITST